MINKCELLSRHSTLKATSIDENADSIRTEYLHFSDPIDAFRMRRLWVWPAGAAEQLWYLLYPNQRWQVTFSDAAEIAAGYQLGSL